ncbi:MAG: NAD-dependent epimerase/dehydratase family protein [Planctomycetota bacterium]|jgi:nucleoside-diphosphate-sugar epimerase
MGNRLGNDLEFSLSAGNGEKMATKKVLITGGSGFIGTNLVESFLAAGHEILSIDIRKPQNHSHNKIFKRVDILDLSTLTKTFSRFAPKHVVHLAARTDLHEQKDIRGYSANIEGVENMVHAISSQPSVERCIFASTKLVCRTGYTPMSNDDYFSNTLYGQSKILSEKIVKNSTTMQCYWCIVRPSSIWGPWCCLPHIPYGKFFKMIAQRRYFHPGHIDPPKSFGYVGNTVFQIETLLNAPSHEINQKVFYLADYDILRIRDWADMISLKLGNRKLRTLPAPFIYVIAWAGDLMKFFGMKEPPFSSFRLSNMRTDTTGIPLEPTKRITGPLPYSLDMGIEEMIMWLRKHDLIH